jgi:hypothetical protein
MPRDDVQRLPQDESGRRDLVPSGAELGEHRVSRLVLIEMQQAGMTTSPQNAGDLERSDRGDRYGPILLQQ